MNIDFKKRNLLLATGGMLLFGSSVAAQRAALPDPKAHQPYDVISPPVATDKQVVRLLFSYECTYCRSYHQGLHQWGRTIPAPLSFVSTPIIAAQENENILYAVLGRLICEKLSPTNLLKYDDLMFSQLQDKQGLLSTPAGTINDTAMMKGLLLAGIPSRALLSFIKNDGALQMTKKVVEHAKIVDTFLLKSTPSVALRGSVLVTPDHAAGNPQYFLQLLNGLLSRTIEGIK